MKRIFINSIKSLVKKINNTISDFDKTIVVIDQNVYNIYQHDLDQINGIILSIPASEEIKTLEIVEYIYETMFVNDFTKQSTLIAIGGGVILDICGYTAATFKRGINYISIPTTTLAMVDASIGGKCGVNYVSESGILKNQIGTFFSPSIIYYCNSFLQSLDQKNYYAGLVEALKMGLTLNKEIYDLLKEDVINEKELIKIATLTKLQITKKDYFDQNIRHVLNFGHTYAHAIETNHHLLHGEAVAIGMIKMIRNKKLKEDVIALIKKWNLKTNIKLTKDDYELIRADKKRNDQMIDVIYLDDIMKYTIERVPLLEIMK